LPREVIELSLDDHEKQYACYKPSLHKIGEDLGELQEFTLAVLKVPEYVRLKYACQHHPWQIPIRNATISARVVVYPVGYQISRNHHGKVGYPSQCEVHPVLRGLETHLLEQIMVQADETALNEHKHCYMWLYCRAYTHQVPVLYNYQNSRARACPAVFSGDYSKYLQTDDYGVYDGIHQVTNIGCLVFVRRKFMDAKKLQGKGKSGKADKALAKIQKLYGIESRLKGESAEKRKAERQLHAKPILGELYEWMTTQQVIESSSLGKAIKYTLGQ